jgi:SAM-dependent methyltransferase
VAPLVAGKRVLDLGSNNGVLAAMMLRAGATEVVGLELSPSYARASHLVREIFEWRDMKEYSLRVENRSMLDVLTEDWGRFDVVTAFCSLYCVEEEFMTQIVRRCRQLAPVMVLQANMPNPGQKAHHPRASAEFLRDVLTRNGFPSVELFAPSDFARPLLVGRAGRAV